MDWSSSGRIDSFRYVRVSWDTRTETEQLSGITGGMLERNDLTSIKASGSLDYIEEPVLGKDLLRVYSESLYPPTGERIAKAHGTYLVSTPSSTYRGAIEAGTADLYSVLKVLADDCDEKVVSLPAGTVAVSKAAEIVRNAGLPVVASASAAKLNVPATFDEDESSLDIVNWLMDFAGFGSAGCDGYGNVLLSPYKDPAQRQPTISMSDDDRCVFRSGVVRSFDDFSVPNVVRVVCSKADGEAMVAVAVNDDPRSAFSTVSRGRRIVCKETVSDIDSQKALQAKADMLLAAKTSAVESFEVKHAYQPMEMGEVCDFTYSRAGIERDDIAAVRQSMKLRPGMECTTRFRRFIRG